MFYLSANNGPQTGRRYELKSDRCVMGRHPDCHIVIDVGAVSRNHCQVLREGEHYFIEDLGSRNGTFLNEEARKIEGRRPLKVGDQIRVCEVTFTFLSDTPVAAPAAVTPLLEGAGLGTVLFDEEGAPSSTIMSKLDVTGSVRGGGMHVAASAEVKLAGLMEITQSLSRALVLDDVLPQLIQGLFRIFVQADRGFIVLEEPGGKLVPRWVRLRRENSTDSVRVSRTIIRHVMESKEAILSADAASDQRFEMSQSIADFRIRSMMCAPLLNSDGKAFGALQIDTLDQRQRFQPEDLELLATVATQASIAITNAQLHEAALKQRELERDMKLAHEVQHGFLPEHPPALSGYQFYDFYQPADQIGGDYYDYIPMPDGRVAIIVADVVGHGVAAALLMAKFSAEARFSLFSEATPAAAVTRLNERLNELNLQRFVTMILVVLDPLEHRATVVNAGHMAPLHRNVRGAVVEPGENIAGLPLGITGGIAYDQFEFEILPGESLTLYTDGINESIDARGEFFTIDRMRKMLTERRGSPTELGQAIIEAVTRFLGRAPQNDDMCLVCFGRVGGTEPLP